MYDFKNILNKSGKDKILILLLVGIIMLVITIPTNTGSSSSTSSFTGTTVSDDSQSLESSLIRCLSKVSGVGDVDAIVTYESDGKTVSGVIIVAKGGDNGTVASDITAAVEALLGLPAHRIKVMKME